MSHHLTVLRTASLTTASVEGHYHVYELNLATLAEHSKRLDEPQRLAPATVGTDDPYERTVLATFLDENGRLKAQPAKRKKFQAILRYALRSWFDDDGPWTEAEISQRLEALTDDQPDVIRATLMRSLVLSAGVR
ncbi:MAG: hypothetical protein ACI9OJ_000950 [Myxococcota bacterium]